MSLEATLERVYTIAFFPTLNSIPRTKRAAKAMRMIRKFVSRHLKTDDVIISPGVNELVWARGIKKPPRKITIRVVKFDDDVAEVHLVDTTFSSELSGGNVLTSKESSEKDIDEEEFDEEED